MEVGCLYCGMTNRKQLSVMSLFTTLSFLSVFKDKWISIVLTLDKKLCTPYDLKTWTHSWLDLDLVCCDTVIFSQGLETWLGPEPNYSINRFVWPLGGGRLSWHQHIITNKTISKQLPSYIHSCSKHGETLSLIWSSVCVYLINVSSLFILLFSALDLLNVSPCSPASRFMCLLFVGQYNTLKTCDESSEPKSWSLCP